MDKELREQVELAAKEFYQVFYECDAYDEEPMDSIKDNCRRFAVWHLQRTIEARIDEIFRSPMKEYHRNRYLELQSQLQQLKDG